MMRSKVIYSLLIACAALFSGCSSDSDNPTDQKKPLPAATGYMQPGGTLILNQGTRMLGNGSLTYISPKGEVEEKVFQKVNHSELGNEALDMALANGKLYILCNDRIKVEGHKSSGALIIADAATLKLEKSYKLEDLTFQTPEGVTSKEFIPQLRGQSNIAVLDEKNIFILDQLGLFRFDSTTGKMFPVEGTYRVSNHGGGMEKFMSAHGTAILNDRLYMAAGGWNSATSKHNFGVYEFEKGKNEVSRKLGLANGVRSSRIATSEGKVWAASYGSKNALYEIDPKKFNLVRTIDLREAPDPGYENISGIAMDGENVYFMGQSTTLKRFSLKKKTLEKLADISALADEAQQQTCGAVVNPANHHVYISSTKEGASESEYATNHLFIYDCSGEKAKLLQQLTNKTDWVVKYIFY